MKNAPYKEKDLLPLIKKINDAGVLSKNGILIIHRHKKEVGKYSENFEVIEEKTYGISKIIFGNYS